ncbi:integrase arm-type DNA-binding domain-containing protein [Litoreibacter halocynthiae]
MWAYTHVSLVQARKAKDAARSSVVAGVDPSEAKQEECGYGHGSK